LLRSLLAMNVVMPLVAVAMALAFHLRPEVETALILLAVAPVPPILPGKEGKAGGDVSYAVGLLMISALVSIVAVPASIALIGRVFGHEIDVPVTAVLKVVAITVLVPLILGTVVRRIAPRAQGLAKPLSAAGSVVLLVALIPILVRAWPAIVSLVGEFTLLAIVLFVLIGLAIGHLLGGPDHEHRTVLALSTAVRHPGVALTLSGVVAHGNPRVAAAVLLAALVGAIVTAPYVKWRKRGDVALAAPAVQSRA
jgi:BASS family bile acid:Na+ symporter